MHVWIVETLFDGKWLQTTISRYRRNDARAEAALWKSRNRRDKYRIRKYIPADDVAKLLKAIKKCEDERHERDLTPYETCPDVYFYEQIVAAATTYCRCAKGMNMSNEVAFIDWHWRACESCIWGDQERGGCKHADSGRMEVLIRLKNDYTCQITCPGYGPKPDISKILERINAKR